MGNYKYDVDRVYMTLTPFFFVGVVLVPIFFSLSFLESYSYIQNFFGLRRQWYWSFSSFVFFRLSSEDVIHDLGVSSLNLKIDACPGRINSCIGYSHTSGLHYRTCSELCRVNHSYMPFLLI